MEAALSGLYALGLAVLPLLLLLLALCLRCRDLPSSKDRHSTAPDSLGSSSLVIKPPPIVVPCPLATPYPPVTALSHLDLRSPQPLGGSHRAPSSREDSDGADSVASYENQGPPFEAKDEDEEDHNGGYLVVLPDDVPALGTAVQPAPSKTSKPGFRDSAVSIESGDDYVNVQESEESADASLDGSREYVNVSQELQPAMSAEPATPSSHEAEEMEEEEEEQKHEEEGPEDDDYENL